MDDRLVELLRKRYPNWRVRVSPEGTWKATRLRRGLTDGDLAAGLACTLMSDTGEALGADLAEQQRIEETRHGSEAGCPVS